MAAWRRNAITLFPQLRIELQDKDFSVYMLYFQLLPMVIDAHEQEDSELLQRAYGFAEWCFDQNAKDLWNSVAVSFYEHLFDGKRMYWDKVVEWLSPKVFDECQSLWELRCSPEELKEIRRLFASRKKLNYLQARALSENL